MAGLNSSFFALMTLFTACVSVSAQIQPTGTWRAQITDPQLQWEVVLRADGHNLFGAVYSCASRYGAREIFDGQTDGNAITFKCRNEDGKRTITFAGRINGDNIVFTWTLQVEEGDNAPAGDGIFAASEPRRFTANRVESSVSGLAEMADYSARIHRDRAITFDRILDAHREPRNWLTYSGDLAGTRYSRLTQITPSNVKNLELAWIWQTHSQANFEATSLVADDVLYTVQAPNDVVALDAATGIVLWTYSYTPMPTARASGGGGRPNRGLAILGDTLFMGTLDAKLLAIDANTGKLAWSTTVADASSCPGQPCYVITHAPLVVKNKVIVGVGGGEGPIRGFIAAFDSKTGTEVWKFHTIPAAGEPGAETWSGDSWKTGGGGVWNTGTYDPDLNLTYWGTGNPYPTRMGREEGGGSARLGDNLYTDSVVALDADTGKLKWHYQFTPHDNMDWDATEIPVLANIEWQGTSRKALLQATKNGLMYVLDRTTGQLLMGKPFVAVNWMDSFDAKGRPVLRPGIFDASEKTVVLPANGTNWYPPSYSPNTGLFYIPSWERAAVGGFMQRPGPGYGAMRAFDPRTGEKKWEFKRNGAIFTAGALTTASDLLFTGVEGDYYSPPAAARLEDRYFYALNARTGDLLWRISLPGSVHGAPMSYSARGKQYIAVAAGNTLFAFALRQ
jgi:alcohol dehydrogenase (cytochrome c)